MVIGISGKKRSGKDTVAEIIMATHSNSVKYSFAAPLKAQVAMACNVSLDFIDKNKDNFRLILQGWGTDFRRKLYGENYWIDKTDDAISRFGNFKHIILPDVRFENEYDYVKSKGGIVIRVNRTRDENNCKPYVDNHSSEISLDNFKFDYTIDNNGTIEELIEKVKQIPIK